MGSVIASGWRGRKALVKVGYGCNENCTFCHTAEVRHIDGASAEVVAKIHRAKQLGHGMVVFSGGEPTIRGELLEWASLTARLGMDVGLVTNGLVLAYPEKLDALLERRLRYVYMSLHGVGRIHDRLVRSEAWEAAYRAVQNLAGRGLDLTINCVVTQQNLEHLIPLVDALLPYPDLRLKFSMVQPKGGGKRLFDAITPRVSDVADRAARAIRHGQEQVAKRGASGPTFGHDGIPHCLLPGLEPLYDDLKTHRFATMCDIGEPDFFPVDEALNVQPEEICGGCPKRGPCPGLFRGYAEQFGVEEIRAPEPAPRSNSFTYTFESQVATDASEAHCPLRDGELGVIPWDRGRELFVRNRGEGGYRVARFRSDTRDFADVEIARTKHALGQLYLDVSRKPAPDDFARDLRPLRRSTLCDGCAHRDTCTGMFEPALDDDPFTRDDARVRDVLRALEGDVLDLGCGEGPYEDVWAPRATSGRVRYVGVDPHADLDALRARWPWATLVRGEGETFVVDRTFDHALILRSWNHLADPSRVVQRVVDALRVGGSLLVVDNVAFGLARTRGQTHVAHRGPARFEHYRNDDADRAARTIEGATSALVLRERHDVGPGTANQWLLRYEKR
ncbi:radical SAM protein [Sandaracinus amylolyticus]|uniref:radical SAM protein n=1 Tax=Sandaracinus amylolyticus TaxID=927083 RepID=UPI00069E8654|nr:radical SAM protein [Sandaracinus amylolyticus]